MRTLLIDNYDSYTYNLFQLLCVVTGSEPRVVRNDELTAAEVERLDVDNVVISPGPGSPDDERDFGICREVLLGARVPVLGVCLGAQGLASAYGGRVVHAPAVAHGLIDRIRHDGSELFAGIPESFDAVRYHSLTVDPDLPPALRALAWSGDGLVMALRHAERPLFGVQFHPESVATEHGARLLENFARPPRERAAAVRTIAPPPACRQTVELRWRHLGDWRDPANVFESLYGESPHAFWLDSSRPDGGRARFSYMGDASGPLGEVVEYTLGSPVRVTRGERTETHDCDVLEYLEDALARLRVQPDERLPFDFNGGFVGYLGYELKALCGSPNAHVSELPDAAFVLAGRVVVFDHLDRELYVLAAGPDGDWLDRAERELAELDPRAHAAPPGEPPATPATELTPSRPRTRYLRDVAEIKRRLRDGETYEACLTDTLRTAAAPPPLELYAALRSQNPAPHAAYLRIGDLAVLSSSPERFLAVGRDGWVESRPIKGTAARGATAADDAAARDALAASAKDRAENLMIVDLTRNDLGRVCVPGTVEVPGLMEVETFESVHHLVSTVRGRLRDGLGPVDCVRAAFPGGSMTGAPKLRTLEILDGLETGARGVYSGALGFLALNGSADLSMVIRTIVRTPAGCSIGAGGAIVMASDPEAELAELLLKAKPLVRAIAAAERRPVTA